MTLRYGDITTARDVSGKLRAAAEHRALAAQARAAGDSAGLHSHLSSAADIYIRLGLAGCASKLLRKLGRTKEADQAQARALKAAMRMRQG